MLNMDMAKKVTTQDFINRSKEHHGDKFDYSLTEYTKNSNKVRIICPTHGEFLQTASDHMRGIGCSKCGRESTGLQKRLTTQEFIEKANNVHSNKFDYSKVDYRVSTEKVEIICPTHGSFFQQPAEHLSGNGCRKCKYKIHSDNLKDTTESFIIKAKEIHGERYDYSLVEYISSWDKIKIICDKHGVFEQMPNFHIHNKSGCPKCKYEKLGDIHRKSPELFIQQAEIKHDNKYDYSITNYNKARDKVDIICPIHGVFSIRAQDHTNNNRGCPACSASQSKPEKYIENLLKEYNINFIMNSRSIISPLELDFYLPDHNIAIEYDGTFYHSEVSGGKDRKYHLNKTQKCLELGIQLLHVFEDEFITKESVVRSKLLNLLSLTPYKIYARKCVIKELDASTKSKFINKYHLQGDAASCVNLGLFHKNRLVQVMTFSKRRQAMGGVSKSGHYELCRLCAIRNFNVVGGASRLLKFFENTYNPKELVSYADKRWGVGKVYGILGFQKTHESAPNYWYFKTNRVNRKWHRYMFAKHKLNYQLKTFDPNLTEWENMRNNEYDRIWDCGNAVFKKIYHYS